MEKPKKYLTPAEALLKLQRYCAYQDRCHREVRTKLLELGVYGDALEEIIVELIAEKFLDEERYARSYARGKFRIKRWGRNRIKRELKSKGVTEYCIRKGMEEIDETEYIEVLTDILTKKAEALSTKESQAFLRNKKVAQYAMSRGFEGELVWEVLREIGLK
ncbi:MAG: recombinase RecX [Saprospiraceae bacterium]|nr:MAG: recombinase RecX [Saprospiraceae bacterium]